METPVPKEIAYYPDPSDPHCNAPPSVFEASQCSWDFRINGAELLQDDIFMEIRSAYLQMRSQHGAWLPHEGHGHDEFGKAFEVLFKQTFEQRLKDLLRPKLPMTDFSLRPYFGFEGLAQTRIHRDLLPVDGVRLWIPLVLPGEVNYPLAVERHGNLLQTRNSFEHSFALAALFSEFASWTPWYWNRIWKRHFYSWAQVIPGQHAVLFDNFRNHHFALNIERPLISEQLERGLNNRILVQDRVILAIDIAYEPVRSRPLCVGIAIAPVWRYIQGTLCSTKRLWRVFMRCAKAYPSMIIKHAEDDVFVL